MKKFTKIFIIFTIIFLGLFALAFSSFPNETSPIENRQNPRNKIQDIGKKIRQVKSETSDQKSEENNMEVENLGLGPNKAQDDLQTLKTKLDSQVKEVINEAISDYENGESKAKLIYKYKSKADQLEKEYDKEFYSLIEGLEEDERQVLIREYESYKEAEKNYIWENIKGSN